MQRLLSHIGPLIRGRPLHSAERYRPFFIVGSGRCGSTLLRAMLVAHPDVHIPPGNVTLHAAIRDFRLYSRLPWSTVLRLVLGRMVFHESWEAFDLPLGATYRELVQWPPRSQHLAAVIDAVYRAHMARHKATATRWGDKSPFGVLTLNEVARVFPDLRVIHILRDGRDVAASFADAFGDDIYRGAMVWLRAIRAAHAFRDRRPAQYLELRYEDLVRRPEDSMRSVAAFLSLPFDERMLRHHEQEQRLGDVDRTPYMQGVRKPVHRESVGRWRMAFSAGQISELERLLHPTLSELGYS